DRYAEVSDGCDRDDVDAGDGDGRSGSRWTGWSWWFRSRWSERAHGWLARAVQPQVQELSQRPRQEVQPRLVLQRQEPQSLELSQLLVEVSLLLLLLPQHLLLVLLVPAEELLLPGQLRDLRGAVSNAECRSDRQRSSGREQWRLPDASRWRRCA